MCSGQLFVCTAYTTFQGRNFPAGYCVTIQPCLTHVIKQSVNTLVLSCD